MQRVTITPERAVVLLAALEAGELPLDDARLAAMFASATGAKRHPNKKDKTDPEILADKMRPSLGELVRKYPFGAMATEAAAFFGVSLPHIYTGIRVLEMSGEAFWERTRDQDNKKIFLVPGMYRRPPQLTKLQEAVFNEINSVADRGVSNINYTRMGMALGLSQGSIVQLCNALEIKGYIARTAPYGGWGKKRPTEYHVYQLEPELVEAITPKIDLEPIPAEAVLVARRIGDDVAVRRALDKRAAMIEEIKKIDAFLGSYSEFGGE